SEVSLIVAAREKLEEEGIAARIVSMPSWELFEMQSGDYKEAVLPQSTRSRLSVEAGVSQGWHKYVGDSGDTISMERFGESAPAGALMQKFGYTVENVVMRAKKLIGRD
ncbi:MAG: transketolase C-terminal domain-containing protein, partial [Acidobacteriota bacterium]